MSPGLLGIVPIPWLRRTRQFLDAPAAMPQTSWRLSGQKSSRGAFTGSDDRLVLRSPQAQPPVAIAIKVDVGPALGIQFVLGESVKKVEAGAACTERPAAESTRWSCLRRSCAARPSPTPTSRGIRGAKTAGLGCSKTSSVDQPISGCCRYLLKMRLRMNQQKDWWS